MQALDWVLDKPAWGLIAVVATLLASALVARSTQVVIPALLVSVAAILMATALVDKQHTYWNNTRSLLEIVRQTAILGIFALGAAIVIISGGIDLSTGSVIAFSGTLCATLMLLLAPEQMKQDKPIGYHLIALAVGGTLIGGFLIGSLHAWLITVVRLPPFVATLATLVGLRSLARAIVPKVSELIDKPGSTQIQISDEQFLDLTKSVPLRVVIFLGLAGLAWLLLSRTVTGRHLYALGGNEEAARLSGLRTDRLKWLAYCLSAMLSSVAGILYIGDQSVADPDTLGRGYELNGIAAAVVGGCSLQGGLGTIPGTMLGALFLCAVIDGVAKVIKTGADVFEGLVVGCVVVIAVALTQLRQLGRRSKEFFPGALGMVNILNLAVLAGTLAALLCHKTAVTSWLSRSPLATWLPAALSRGGTVLLGVMVALVVLVLLFVVRLMQGRRSQQFLSNPKGQVP